MMSNYYIDTCALKWRYLNGNPTPDVNQLMDNPNASVTTSELTILEWSSALASSCRDGTIDYDLFKLNELALMTDIAVGKLLIFPMTRAIERARYLIEYVGIHHGRALRTGDSIQVTTALNLSSTMHTGTTFVTCDETLSNIIRDIGEFRPQLDSLYLPP